jgi:hypothetical protein
MGAVEALVHTHDLSQGLSVTWEPPSWLVGRVLGHLFDVDQTSDGHWSDLLLATGRIPDAQQVFVSSWRWQNTGS